MFDRLYKQDSNFVYIKITGELDDGQLTDLITLINKEFQNKDLMILCDCREIVSTDRLTSTGIASCGQLDMDQAPGIDGKLAVLVSNELVYGFARIFGMFAEKNEGEIEIFYSFADAITFLNLKESIEEIADLIKFDLKADTADNSEPAIKPSILEKTF